MKKMILVSALVSALSCNAVSANESTPELTSTPVVAEFSWFEGVILRIVTSPRRPPRH